MSSEHVFQWHCYESNIVASLKMNVFVCPLEVRGPSLSVDIKVQNNGVWNKRDRPAYKDHTCLSFCILRNRHHMHLTNSNYENGYISTTNWVLCLSKPHSLTDST